MNFVSESALIGEGTKIWHFSYVGHGTLIGKNCKIGSLVHIDYNVVIGDNCKIEGMAYIPPLSRIGNNVFIGPNVILTNDPYPMSDRMIGVIIEDDSPPEVRVDDCLKIKWDRLFSTNWMNYNYIDLVPDLETEVMIILANL